MAAGGLESGRHRHREAQLVYIVRGEVTCEAAGAWWIVPPNSALWVPGDVEHLIRACAPLEGYNVFLEPKAARRLPAECCAVSVNPLLREVVLRLATRPSPHEPSGPDAHLVAVLLDELATVSVDKHRLPMPTDPRLQELVARMTAKPADGAKMKTWAKRIGVAERTLTRLLVHETGLSFGRWRQQLHVVLAIQSMSRGASVKSVASDLGYESSSGFVTMFRRALGMSPGRYMAERRAAHRD
jgi:AraC-like DNA-binding protein